MLRQLIVGAVTLVALAGPALANQCPLLIKQVNDAVDHRLAGEDFAGAKARKLAKEAEALHNEGKHDEAMQKIDEAAAAIMLKLNK